MKPLINEILSELELNSLTEDELRELEETNTFLNRIIQHFAELTNRVSLSTERT